MEVLNHSNPWKKDWGSYSPADLGNTFFTYGAKRERGRCYLYDPTAVFEDFKLVDAPLKLDGKDARLFVFTFQDEVDLKDKYAKTSLQPFEICAFFLKKSNGDLSLKLKVHPTLEKKIPLKKGKRLADYPISIDPSKLKRLKSAGLSIWSLLSLVESKDLHVRTRPQKFESLEEGPFNAGISMNSTSHGNIEFEALEDVFDRPEIFQTYYGNWLRDFSQVNIGMLIAPPPDIIKELAAKTNRSLAEQKILDEVGTKLTQDAMVTIIELLASKEFFHNIKPSESSKVTYENRFQYVRNFMMEYGTLTRDILGIYRPEEHIDNPKGLEDDSAINSSYAYFDYEYPLGVSTRTFLYKGEDKESLKIDGGSNMISPACDPTGLKYYIFQDISPQQPSSPGAIPSEIMYDRPAATTYMKQQLELAIASGRNKKGFRHLGAALHVLEDYFAHTNFAEITMIKLGKTAVYAWVDTVEETNNNVNTPKTAEELQNPAYRVVNPPYTCKYEDMSLLATHIPIVTGRFLMDDTIASIVPKIAQVFPLDIEGYYEMKEGERSFGDLLILMVLKDLSATHGALPEEDRPSIFGVTASGLLEGYEYYLSVVDGWRYVRSLPILEVIRYLPDRALHWIGQIMKFYRNLLINLFVPLADDAIKEAQSDYDWDHGTNPSHTQLAKDPADHPLNPLAGQLAVAAVKDVGTRIKAAWNGEGPTGKEIADDVAATYFVHPCKTQWMDEIVLEWMKKNADAVKAAERRSWADLLIKILDPYFPSPREVKEVITEGNVIDVIVDGVKKVISLEDLIAEVQKSMDAKEILEIIKNLEIPQKIPLQFGPQWKIKLPPKG